MADSEIVNVAVSSRNGLCGPFPVIELFAFVYGPAPMIRWDGGGAVGAGVPPAGHITQMNAPAPPDNCSAHPVLTVLPSVKLLLLFTVRSVAELDMLAEPFNEELSANWTLLSSWPMLVGLANRSLSVIVSVPGPVAKTADAFTDPLEVVLPDGVTNVIVVPDAIPEIVRAVASRRTAKIFQLVLINVSSSALQSV
jgi:hypothetical protein